MNNNENIDLLNLAFLTLSASDSGVTRSAAKRTMAIERVAGSPPSTMSTAPV